MCAGCGAPGGVCVCPCGCVKGAGVGGLNDKKAIERVSFDYLVCNVPLCFISILFSAD